MNNKCSRCSGNHFNLSCLYFKQFVEKKEVLKLIVEEFTTQEIAKELFISLKTMKSRISSLLAKRNA